MGKSNQITNSWQGHPEGLELVDFKCSEYWSNHFYAIGYSRHKPPSPKARLSTGEAKLRRDLGHVVVEMNGLYSRCEGLTRKVDVLSKEVEGLKTQLSTNLIARLAGVPVEDLE